MNSSYKTNRFKKIKNLRTTALILFGLIGPIVLIFNSLVPNENLTMLLAALLSFLEVGFLIYVVLIKCPNCNNPFYGGSASYLLKNKCLYCGYPTDEGWKN